MARVFELAGELERKQHVLELELGAEAAGVAARRRDAFHRARIGVELLEGEVGARTGSHDVRKDNRVEAVGDAERQGFGRADHADAGKHVVADLGGLPGTARAGVNDVLAHRLHQWPGPLQVLGIAADHEGQRPRLGADGAARHRRVDHPAPPLFHLGGELAGHRDRDRAAVHEEHPSRQRIHKAALAEIDVTHVIVGRQHCHDHLGALCRLYRRPRGSSAVGDKVVDAFRHEIEAGDAVPGLEQVSAHGLAHVADPDEGDAHISVPPVPTPQTPGVP